MFLLHLTILFYFNFNSLNFVVSFARFGRKRPLITNFIGSGVASLIVAFTPKQTGTNPISFILVVSPAKTLIKAKIQMERRQGRKFQFSDVRREGKSQRVIPGKTKS